jgi:hypothetical protein
LTVSLRFRPRRSDRHSPSYRNRKHDHDRQQWFWDDAASPWDDPRRIREEEDRLASYVVTGLPALVELLPIQVASIGNVEMPRRILERMRHPERLAG